MFVIYRNAVQNCPEDEEESSAMTTEEKQSLLNIKQTQIRHLSGQYLVEMIHSAYET